MEIQKRILKVVQEAGDKGTDVHELAAGLSAYLAGFDNPTRSLGQFLKHMANDDNPKVYRLGAKWYYTGCGPAYGKEEQPLPDIPQAPTPTAPPLPEPVPEGFEEVTPFDEVSSEELEDAVRREYGWSTNLIVETLPELPPEPITLDHVVEVRLVSGNVKQKGILLILPPVMFVLVPPGVPVPSLSPQQFVYGPNELTGLEFDFIRANLQKDTVELQIKPGYQVVIASTSKSQSNA